MAANATPTVSARTLAGEEVLKVKRTSLVRPYKDGAAEGFKGKSYRIYAFGEKAFTVHEDDDFHADFQKGNIKSIDVAVSEEGWSLDNYISWTRANGLKRNQAIYDSITPEMFKLHSEAAYAELS
jgi:hypothetical protein